MNNVFTVGASDTPRHIEWSPVEFLEHEEGIFGNTLEEDLEYLRRLRRLDLHRRVKEEIFELEQLNGVHRTYPNHETTLFNDSFYC